MKVVVMGAGAVGCYYGAMLARAGCDVTLIGRSGLVAAVQDGGLHLHTQSFQARVAIAAATDAAAARGADIVLLCVKAADTAAAGLSLAPHLAVGTPVLCLQNGVDNAARLRAVLPAASVVPAAVYAAVEMVGAGRVRHHGGGELVLGPAPGIAAFADACAHAGVPVRISANVAGELWTKLIVNCCFNPMSAITRLPYGPMLQGAGAWDVMRDVAAECLEVARAEGIAPAGDPWQALQRIARTMPAQISSMAQDIGRGRPTEIDYLNGYIVRRGEELGVHTPVNRALQALVKLLEPGRAAPAPSPAIGRA